MDSYPSFLRRNIVIIAKIYKRQDFSKRPEDLGAKSMRRFFGNVDHKFPIRNTLAGFFCIIDF